MEDEYPPCKICGAEWIVLPPEHNGDEKTAYLQHQLYCEYAKKRLNKYDEDKKMESHE